MEPLRLGRAGGSDLETNDQCSRKGNIEKENQYVNRPLSYIE